MMSVFSENGSERSHVSPRPHNPLRQTCPQSKVKLLLTAVIRSCFSPRLLPPEISVLSHLVSHLQLDILSTRLSVCHRVPIHLLFKFILGVRKGAKLFLSPRIRRGSARKLASLVITRSQKSGPIKMAK